MSVALVEDMRALWRSRALLAVLVRREIDARHAGTAAGIVWPYLQPLLVIAAYYLVLDVVFAMRLGPEAPVRAVGTFLIVGALPWMAFCDALSRGAGSLVESGGILQKNALPPVLFPIRSVLGSAVIFLPLTLVVVVVYALFQPGAAGFSLLALLPLAVLQLVLCGLLAYLFGILTAALRDTQQVVSFFLSVGIYLSPVLFPVALFPIDWRWALWINPMTPFVLGYQQVLLAGAWPSVEVWIGAIAWIAGTAPLLSLVVTRSREQLVDWL